MKAKILPAITEINTGLSVGVTFKTAILPKAEEPDNATLIYLKMVVEFGKRFEKLGWQVSNQEHDGNEYVVCAKYILSPVDYKLISAARSMVDAFAPKSFLKE